VPIDEVARSLGLRASAIRYYEQRGLLSPASRQAGRRWYGPAGIRRLAIIRHWQEAGRMSRDEIADILAL
jgi:MerR family copper efflux transcriptional regulator